MQLSKRLYIERPERELASMPWNEESRSSYHRLTDDDVRELEAGAKIECGVIRFYLADAGGNDAAK